MNPSQANTREYLRQTIDDEIQSFEESIRALRRRRNALAPISSLPPEVFATIFSFVRLPDCIILSEPDQLACLRVSQVCHQWREIALNQPLLWSHIDFTSVTSAGAAEMLSRARAVPLHLEAIVPICHWDDSQFSAFQKELQAHISHTCHLGISTVHLRLREILEGLISPAPTLEYLSLSIEGHEHRQLRVSIPDNIFAGSTPRLSCLILKSCDISWKSPLLRGLIHLDIRTPSTSGRPSLAAWLDMLDEMPQLKTLALDSASPLVSNNTSLPPDVQRVVTLTSLIHLELSASARDCGLALAHLALPALNWLCLMVKSCSWDGADVREVLPYVSRHAHGSQDAQPLRSMFVSSEKARIHIMAWTKPDIDIELRSPIALFVATRSARVTFIATNDFWSPGVEMEVFDAAMAALPMDSVVTLTVQDHTKLLDKEVWLRHAPRWPLLQRVRLTPSAAHGLRGVLLEDHWERENILLPSLTNLVLVESILSACRTLRLCDVMMKRVEQGVPLELLDLRTCLATSRAVELLGEIVVDVLGPAETMETRAQFPLMRDHEARGLFIPDIDSDVETDDGDDDDSDEDEDAAEMAYWGIGNYEPDYEDEDDYDYSML
jgi:hypothetical protein